MTQRRLRKVALSTTVLLILLGAIRALGEGGAGFDLTLIDVEGNKTVLGTLPPSTLCATHLTGRQAHRLRNA